MVLPEQARPGARNGRWTKSKHNNRADRQQRSNYFIGTVKQAHANPESVSCQMVLSMRPCLATCVETRECLDHGYDQRVQKSVKISKWSEAYLRGGIIKYRESPYAPVAENAITNLKREGV